MMRLAMMCMTLLLVLAAGVNEHKFSPRRWFRHMKFDEEF